MPDEYNYSYAFPHAKQTYTNIAFYWYAFNLFLCLALHTKLVKLEPSNF